MGGCLTVEVHQGLNPLTASEWGRLFPPHLDAGYVASTIAESAGLPVRFHSVIVRHDGQAVVLLPLMETGAGPIRRMLERLGEWLGLGDDQFASSICGTLQDVDACVAAEARRLAVKIASHLASGAAARAISLADLAPASDTPLPVETFAVS